MRDKNARPQSRGNDVDERVSGYVVVAVFTPLHLPEG